MSRCKCPKSDVPKREQQCPPYFEDITIKMEERRCDLVGKQKYLREKITTMERSIPALIAYNLWMAKKCEDAPYCKVRQIMKKFAPYPDQTEKLLSTLKNTIKELNGETEELHEKIIQADVKLEETEMELESVEFANKELNEALNNLEREIRRHTTPSIHSIHSEDVLCLSKIRQLAEEELNLKHCIKALEQKETLFQEHVDKLLTCKEYQNACTGKKPIFCLQDLACCPPKPCCTPKKCLRSKEGGQMKKQGHEEDVTIQTEKDVATSMDAAVQKQDKANKVDGSAKCPNICKPSWISNWWKSNKKSEEQSQKKENPSLQAENPKEEKASSNQDAGPAKSKSAQCHRPCIDAKDVQRILKSCIGKAAFPCNLPCNLPCNMPCGLPCKSSAKGCTARSLLCQLPRCSPKDHGIKGCKAFSLPCDIRGPCEMCPAMPCKDMCRPPGNCRCNCKGKCSLGLSDAECNCSDEPLGASETYQPIGSTQLADSRRHENSDDEFCECCSCGCEESDDDILCNCI